MIVIILQLIAIILIFSFLIKSALITFGVYLLAKLSGFTIPIWEYG